MRILLTGSNGFLGKIIYYNISRYYDVYTLNKRCSNYNFDIVNDNVLFDHSFDCIIHAAGKAHLVPVSIEEINSFQNINVKGTKNILEALTKSFIPRYFIFVSSVSVYGLSEGSGILENAPLLANDPYGKSKIEAEYLVSEWCNKHNVICTILRLPLVIGPNPPGNLGTMIKGIIKGYYFNIAGGHAKKSMVLGTDIARFIIKASEVGGVYNLTDGYHPSFGELSYLISNQLGKSSVPTIPLFIATFLARLGDFLGPKFPINRHKLSKVTSTLTFDDSKARIAFGWNPTTVLDGFKISSHV